MIINVVGIILSIIYKIHKLELYVNNSFDNCHTIISNEYSLVATTYVLTSIFHNEEIQSRSNFRHLN